MNRGTAEQVVALVPSAELRQAEYYRAVLDAQRGRLEDQIACHRSALKACRDNGAVREMRRLRRLRQPSVRTGRPLLVSRPRVKATYSIARLVVSPSTACVVSAVTPWAECTVTAYPSVMCSRR